MNWLAILWSAFWLVTVVQYEWRLRKIRKSAEKLQQVFNRYVDERDKREAQLVHDAIKQTSQVFGHSYGGTE